MRFRDLVFLLALPAFPAWAAQDISTSSSNPASTQSKFRHGAVLRDNEADAAATARSWRGSFPLPPGGRELELQPTSGTPYDRYFGNLRSVIANMEPHAATMYKACHLMKVGHSFEYKSRDPYRPDPPRLTELLHSGDCKSKALWLYGNLADSGALFVIGKSEKNLRTSHAWVYWRCDGRWWILDCTDRVDPVAADSVSSDRYVPYYSFGKLGTYRHPATQLSMLPATGLAANGYGGAPIADQRKAR